MLHVLLFFSFTKLFYFVVESVMFTNTFYIFFYINILILFLFFKINIINILVSNLTHIVNYIFLFYILTQILLKKLKYTNILNIFLFFYFIGGLFWSYVLYKNYWSWDIIEIVGFFTLFFFILNNHLIYKNLEYILITILILFKLYYFNFFSSLHIFNINNKTRKETKNATNLKVFICYLFFLIKNKKQTNFIFIVTKKIKIIQIKLFTFKFNNYKFFLHFYYFLFLVVCYQMDNRNIFFQNNWYSNEWNFTIDLSNTWMNNRLSKITYNYILKYAFNILVPNFKFTSVFGFSLLVNMITQMWSGFLLSLYYVPDPTLVMTFREEYINEVWWFFYVYKIHVIGVDSIFVLSYLHILKKIYIKNYIGTPIQGWTTGTYAFLVYHVVVFLGITLSSNHLGDLTLTIGASIFWSIFLSKHKIYAPIFTNKHLNTEQLTRFMVAHYLVAWYYIYLVQTHVMFIHEMWDLDSGITEPQETNTPKGSWIWDALQKEASSMVFIYILFMTKFIKDGHPDIRVVNFNFFEQWSEVEVEDINFFIVGPHWYFRPHMGLLTVCAQHYEGLFWLVFYYISLTLLPVWSRILNLGFNSLKSLVISLPTKDSKLQKITFLIFLMSLAYVGGTLPCARFYYADDEGFFGNSLLRLSYQYLYIYLIFIVHLVDKIEKRVCTLAIYKKKITK